MNSLLSQSIRAFALLGLSAALFAAPTPEPVKHEVAALLDRLQASGCQFERNGTWYSGKEARNHLLQKLDYLESHTSLTSTEQFINQAASQSSMSGKPYHVRCGQAAAVPSRDWLGTELAAMRHTSAPGGK
jgi:hypothetical protein